MGMGFAFIATDPLNVYDREGLPLVPRFVLITMTPLAAREPHKAVAAASFKIVISFISEGAIFSSVAYPWSSAVPKLKSEGTSVSYGIPSTTISGSLEELIEEVPRM